MKTRSESRPRAAHTARVALEEARAPLETALRRPYTGVVPELPEVETVVRQLRPEVVGRELTGARVGWERTVGGAAAKASFARRVKGRRISAVWRRAKFLVFDLERGGRADGHLVAHLRMSGRFHVEPEGADPGPWCRLALGLDDGRELRFVDPRKFGRVLRVDATEALFEELGPEPLDPAFDAASFAEALRARRGVLKPLLLDQTFLAGLGNIYVDEALFAARLHPLTLASRVPPERALALHAAIRATLESAIAREGSSFDTFYRTPSGQPGAYQDQFQVYGRRGEPCRACGTPIRRIVVGQRGTHVCPTCQSKPRRRS